MTEEIKLGDKFTLPGHYKRRTFLEWLTRKPRELQVFTITSSATCAGEITEYEPTDA